MSGPSKYKFLDSLNIKRIDTPTDGRGYAETWPAGETGDEAAPRPKEIPINQHGVQVFRPAEFSDDDLAGEALHLDPVAAKYREQFSGTLSKDQKNELMRQPDYKAGTSSEERKMQNAVDAAMRGYLVGQWPKEEVARFFDARQRKILDELKSYMESGQTPEQQLNDGFNQVRQ